MADDFYFPIQQPSLALPPKPPKPSKRETERYRTDKLAAYRNFFDEFKQDTKSKPTPTANSDPLKILSQFKTEPVRANGATSGGGTQLCSTQVVPEKTQNGAIANDLTASSSITTIDDYLRHFIKCHSHNPKAALALPRYLPNATTRENPDDELDQNLNGEVTTSSSTGTTTTTSTSTSTVTTDSTANSAKSHNVTPTTTTTTTSSAVPDIPGPPTTETAIKDLVESYLHAILRATYWNVALSWDVCQSLQKDSTVATSCNKEAPVVPTTSSTLSKKGRAGSNSKSTELAPARSTALEPSSSTPVAITVSEQDILSVLALLQNELPISTVSVLQYFNDYSHVVLDRVYAGHGKYVPGITVQPLADPELEAEPLSIGNLNGDASVPALHVQSDVVPEPFDSTAASLGSAYTLKRVLPSVLDELEHIVDLVEHDACVHCLRMDRIAEYTSKSLVESPEGEKRRKVSLSTESQNSSTSASLPSPSFTPASMDCSGSNTNAGPSMVNSQSGYSQPTEQSVGGPCMTPNSLQPGIPNMLGTPASSYSASLSSGTSSLVSSSPQNSGQAEPASSSLWVKSATVVVEATENAAFRISREGQSIQKALSTPSFIAWVADTAKQHTLLNLPPACIELLEVVAWEAVRVVVHSSHQLAVRSALLKPAAGPNVELQPQLVHEFVRHQREQRFGKGIQ